MEILIIGAIKEAKELVETLVRGGNKVVIVDESRHRLNYYEMSQLDVPLHQKDPRDLTALDEVEISNADVVFAIHPSDEVNLIVSIYAKMSGVPRIVTMLSREKLAEGLQQLGISGAVVLRDIGISRMLLEAMFGVKLIDLGEHYLVVLEEGNEQLIGSRLEDLKDSMGAVGVIREHGELVTEGEHIVKKGDRVMLMVRKEDLTRILRLP